jgi:anti-sigma-K factor RskA
MEQHTEQDLLNAQVRKLQREADKLDRELERLSRPLWRHPSFWRSVLAAAAISAAISRSI